jgi:hypothetical protein
MLSHCCVMLPSSDKYVSHNQPTNKHSSEYENNNHPMTGPTTRCPGQRKGCRCIAEPLLSARSARSSSAASVPVGALEAPERTSCSMAGFLPGTGASPPASTVLLATPSPEPSCTVEAGFPAPHLTVETHSTC